MSKYIRNGSFRTVPLKDCPYECEVKFRIKNVLFDGKSNYQDILIFDSEEYGKVLVLDGGVQMTTSDEFAYHEMIAFTSLACHKLPKNVLIVGGRDGGMAKQALKFSTVETIDICEIDELVIEKCKEFVPETSCSYSDARCNVILEDAFTYLKSCNSGKYDVVICDCTDQSTMSERLFGFEFYTNIKRVLSSHGIVAAQTGGTMWQSYREQIDLVKIAKQIFPIVQLSYVSVPAYPCGQNGFIVCSKDASQNLSEPYRQFNEEQLDRMGILYYSTQLHNTCFNIPRFARKVLLEQKDETPAIETKEFPYKEALNRINKNYKK